MKEEEGSEVDFCGVRIRSIWYEISYRTCRIPGDRFGSYTRLAKSVGNGSKVVKKASPAKESSDEGEPVPRAREVQLVHTSRNCGVPVQKPTEPTELPGTSDTPVSTPGVQKLYSGDEPCIFVPVSYTRYVDGPLAGWL